jgi:hypothetical protein
VEEGKVIDDGVKIEVIVFSETRDFYLTDCPTRVTAKN